MKYTAYCGNSFFSVSAKNILEALNYAIKRFDDEVCHTEDVEVLGEDGSFLSEDQIDMTEDQYLASIGL